MKISAISKLSAVYVSLAFLMSLFFLFVQVLYPACCDAEQYVVLGKLYAEKGIAANSSDAAVRTYFYPLVIGYLYKISVHLMFPLNIFVYFMQFALYIFAVNKYVSVINVKFPIYRIIQGALIFNLFVYPFFSLTLTDSIYTSLVILWIYAAIRMTTNVGQNMQEMAGLGVVCLPGFLASIIFVVRPAGLWVLVTMAVMYIWFIYKTDSWKERALNLLVITGCMALPLIPQIYINTLNYGRVTPFPVFDLGAAQLQWGIENIKYGTYLGGGNPQVFYLNPFYVSGQGFEWYLNNPIHAIGTLILKLVAAFDCDYIFPFFYNKSPWYGLYTGMISIFILLMGMWGVLVHAFRPEAIFVKVGPRYLPLVCFVTWSGISLLSAIELRFTLPMYGLLLPFAVERVSFLYYRQRQFGLSIKRPLLFLLGFYIILLCISYYSRMQISFK